MVAIDEKKTVGILEHFISTMPAVFVLFKLSLLLYYNRFWVSVGLVSLQDVVGSCPCTSGSIVRTELLDLCTGKPECISIAAHVCSKRRYRRVSPRRHPKTSLEASVCRRRSTVMCTYALQMCPFSKHVTQKYIFFSLNNCFFLYTVYIHMDNSWQSVHRS